MFSWNPPCITLVTRDVEIAMKGKEARITSEKLHPLEKAKAKPENVIAKANMIVPIFSPSAF